MAEETETIASLMARKEYARAVPLLKRDLEKYSTNVRIRLQYADALAGAGMVQDAATQYGLTAKFYEDNGLVVQAIAVRKKLEKLQPSSQSSASGGTEAPDEPTFAMPVPKSPLFENLTDQEREALVREMVLQQFNEGDIVITEGEEGSSLYVIVSGEVKVYTRAAKGDQVYLAKLREGDFFGEVSVLTGRKRTATITASQQTELLRLDKESFDRVAQANPRVREILDEFYRKRATHTVEAMIESLKQQRSG